MIKYQDYEEVFREFNISEVDGKAIFNYLTQIIDIAIESYNEQR